VTVPSEAVRADRIALRGGGQIRGKVIPDPKHDDRVTVLTERGKTPLSFQKERITSVVPEPSPLDEYVTRRDQAPATAEGQYELGIWCERHKLTDLAAVHYEAAVARDKEFAPAHQKLGHVRFGDRWLKGDELREAQGLVRDHGRWITREEQEQREKDRATAADQVSWARRIRLFRDAIVNGAEDRQREAESQLMEIRDPVAVAPLMKVLGGDAPSLRTLLARVLGQIPGPESARALVVRVLSESDPDVRQTTMSEVESRNTPEVATQLVKALHSSNPEVVNRAGWALGRLGAVSAVPRLVNALVTTRYQTVMAPSAGGFGEGSSIAATFGSIPPTSPIGATPIAYNGSSVGYLTGAVVGPGVAAYGAASAPCYPFPNPLASLPSFVSESFGASTGIPAGGGLSASRGPTPRIVSVTVQNAEVLTALVKLTGEDFGYDVSAWKRWVRTAFQAAPVPARRVPQP